MFMAKNDKQNMAITIIHRKEGRGHEIQNIFYFHFRVNLCHGRHLLYLTFYPVHVIKAYVKKLAENDLRAHDVTM